MSIHRNHCAAVATILAAGASVFGLPEDSCPVLVCCRMGRLGILDQILKYAARAKDKAQMSSELNHLRALTMATEHGQEACIRVLSPYSVCPDGALHIAVQHG